MIGWWRRRRNDHWRLKHFADRGAYRAGEWRLRPDVRRALFPERGAL